ncbi:MAG: ATP-binding cassette domain-containing protein [Firmicutes bacterium]|nr:ATP-binding cassette domain-containing protein [Bacillota bacterium]
MGLIVDIRKKLKSHNLDVSFETHGEYLAFLGASGSGKSMTLKCIAGIETPDEGRIVLNDKVLFDSKLKINLKPQERNIGYFFQNYALFPHMTVEENIGIGLVCSKKEKMKRVQNILKKFHLEGEGKKHPNQLSGGEQQRIALARCLIYKPDVLMLDEPFSALDMHLKEKLQNEVLEMLKDYSGEVLMVTHSRDEAYKFCKNLVILDQGKTVMTGNTKEIFKQPKLLITARLTGCKNISKCDVLSQNRLRAIDWGLDLEIEKEIPLNITHIGVRAHNLVSVANAAKKNTIACKIKKIYEDMFEYDVIATKDHEDEYSEIIYKVKKQDWDLRREEETLYLQIPEEEILFLN